MKDTVKYGHELLDIEIPDGIDLSVLLPGRSMPDLQGRKRSSETPRPAYWRGIRYTRTS